MSGETRHEGRPKSNETQLLLRRIRVLEMRRGGKSLRAIAAVLGISHTQVRNDIEDSLSALRESEHGRTDGLRILELLRLDVAVAGMMPGVRKGNPMSVDRLLKISERRTKLLGLDAPTEHQVAVLDDPKELALQALAEARAAGLDEARAVAALVALGVIPEDLPRPS